MIVLMVLVACFGLFSALLPELVATLAGVKKDRRMTGLYMLHGTRRKKYPEAIIFGTKILCFAFLGMTLADIALLSFWTFLYNATMAFSLYRIYTSYLISNSFKIP